MAVNPIIPGFAPDPSVDRIGDTFFLVNSTFHLFPGLPIYASRDLVTWTQIGNAINRQSQLSLRLSDTKLHPQEDGTVMLATGGLFAPTIRHDRASGKTYVINTNVVHPEDGGDDICENFIVSTDDIWSDKWSDPVWFDFKGIDPSIFWDSGKAYVCGSKGPGPMTKINLFEIDLLTGKHLSEEKTIWDGTGGIYPEGPHIYKKNDSYYLLISEGGTFKDHMITVARSKNIWGPYEVYSGNPILTARGTSEYVQCTGHSDIFQDQDGGWWGVCLAMRMKNDKFMMGRESFLIPARWDGEWPELDQVVVDPKLRLINQTQNGNLQHRKHADWLYIRDANLGHHKVVDEQGKSSITLTSSQADISQWKENVSFVGKRQRKLNGRAAVRMTVPEHGIAGLVNYKDEHRYARVFVDVSKQQIVFEVVNNASKISRKHSSSMGKGRLVTFNVDYTEDSLEFSFGQDDKMLERLGEVDTAELSNADFVGPVFGVFAVSDKSVEVKFDSFVVDEQ